MVLSATELDTSSIELFIISIERQSLLLVKFALKNNVEAVDLLETVVVSWVKKNTDTSPTHWRFSFFKQLSAAVFHALHRQFTLMQSVQSRSELQFYESIQQPSSDCVPSSSLVLTAVARLPLPLMWTFILCDWLAFTEKEVASMLHEQESLIHSRLVSVRVGLNNTIREQVVSEALIDDVPLLQSMLRCLDQACAATDYVELHQLRAMRYAALRKAESISMMLWLLPSIMAICLLLFWWLNLPKDIERPLALYSGESLVDALPQAWQEDTELLINMNFYQWLTTTLNLDNQRLKRENYTRFNHAQWREFPEEQKVIIVSHYHHFLRLPQQQQQAIHKAYYFYSQLSAESKTELQHQWQEAFRTTK